MKIIALYLLTIPVFFGIDILWIGLIAKGFYRSNLAHLIRPDLNWVAAGSCYLLYIAGILIFAVLPVLKNGSFSQAALLGTLFGFIVYATYDLTNLATLRDWPIKFMCVDILWGTILTACVAGASFLIGRRIMP